MNSGCSCGLLRIPSAGASTPSIDVRKWCPGSTEPLLPSIWHHVTDPSHSRKEFSVNRQARLRFLSRQGYAHVWVRWIGFVSEGATYWRRAAVLERLEKVERNASHFRGSSWSGGWSGGRAAGQRPDPRNLGLVARRWKAGPAVRIRSRTGKACWTKSILLPQRLWRPAWTQRGPSSKVIRRRRLPNPDQRGTPVRHPVVERTCRPESSVEPVMRPSPKSRDRRPL